MARKPAATTEFVDYGRMAQLDRVGDLSMMALVYPTVDAIGIPFGHDISVTSPNFSYALEVGPNGSPGFNIRTNDGGSVARTSLGSSLTLNAWTVIGGTYDASTKTVQTYNNGAAGGSAVLATGLTVLAQADRTTKIGNDLSSHYFQGRIAWVAVWMCRLLPAEVSAVNGEKYPSRVQRDKLAFYRYLNGAAVEHDLISGWPGIVTGCALAADPAVNERPLDPIQFGARL